MIHFSSNKLGQTNSKTGTYNRVSLLLKISKEEQNHKTHNFSLAHCPLNFNIIPFTPLFTTEKNAVKNVLVQNVSNSL